MKALTEGSVYDTLITILESSESANPVIFGVVVLPFKGRLLPTEDLIMAGLVEMSIWDAGTYSPV